MKINKKALRLIDKGLSANTVSKLDESQIDVLYKKLFVEQVNVSKTDTEMISKLKSEKKLKYSFQSIIKVTACFGL